MHKSSHVYKVGESFSLPGSNDVGTFQLTVDGVSSTVDPAAVQAYTREFGSAPSRGTDPDPGWKWVIVPVHGTNTGNQPGFFLTQFFVLTAGGKQFDISLSDQKARDIASGYNYIKNHELSTMSNPEETGYEWVVYQVPSNLPVQSILISSSRGDASAIVDLTGH